MKPRRWPWLVFGLTLATIALGVAISPERVTWDALWLLPFLAYGVVGALVASYRPQNRIGWVFLAVGLFGALASLQAVAEFVELMPGRGVLWGAVVILSFAGWFGGLGTMLTLALLLFPDGRLPSPRWRPVLWVTIVAIPLGGVTEYLTSELATTSEAVASVARVIRDAIALPLLMGAAVASVASVVVRFRRSRGEERRQLKWFTYAASILILGIAATAVGEAIGADEGAISEAIGVLLALTVAGIPVGAGVAILRHRLYDIDLVINKTLVYGGLATFITAVYVGVVVGAGNLIGARGEPDLVLQIAATALVAVAFQPVRTRVQRLANRLVYGKRSSPYEVLAGFSDTVAGTYAAEDVLPRMARVVAEGTGAVASAVWVRVHERLFPAAFFPPNGDRPPAPVPIEDAEAIPGADRALAIRHRGEVLGALAVRKAPGDPLRPQEASLLEHLASQAGLVLRNVTLTEQLRARVEETTRLAAGLRESRRRIVAAQDATRRRLERNIHDGAQQHLVALAVNLKLARTVAAKDPARSRGLIGQTRERTRETLDVLRDLAGGIYPAALEAEGLGAALREAVARAAVPVVVSGDTARAPIEVEAAVYFTIMEALQNAVKYADASEVWVRLDGTEGRLGFEVVDDGRGFDPARVARGAGLENMEDRISAVGGVVEIGSAPGRGTTVRGSVPLHTAEAAS